MKKTIIIIFRCRLLRDTFRDNGFLPPRAICCGSGQHALYVWKCSRKCTLVIPRKRGNDWGMSPAELFFFFFYMPLRKTVLHIYGGLSVTGGWQHSAIMLVKRHRSLETCMLKFYLLRKFRKSLVFFCVITRWPIAAQRNVRPRQLKNIFIIKSCQHCTCT